MASNDQNQASPQSQESPKVGSDPNAVRNVGGKGDFGVPAGGERTRDRDYTSANTKASDPGAAHPASWEEDGVRTHGAGSLATGEGSGSGGDLDTDIIGVGTGGSGIAASGNVGRPSGPDDSDGSSNEMASGPPAKGENQGPVGTVGGSKRVDGSVMSGDLDMQTGSSAQGADAATNPNARGDDSFAGEISSGEAAGEDLPISPSSDDQGLTQPGA